MRGFCNRQIAQQFPGGGVGAAPGGGKIEPLGVMLHYLGLGADALQPQVFDQPNRAAGVETCHMFAPDQRNGLAEPLRMQVDQQGAMLILFRGHAIEHTRAGRVVGAQALSVTAIDARVILLGRNRQGDDLLFGQVAEPLALAKEIHVAGPNLESF